MAQRTEWAVGVLEVEVGETTCVTGCMCSLAFSPLFSKKWDLVKFGADGIPDAIWARLWAGPCRGSQLQGLARGPGGNMLF